MGRLAYCDPSLGFSCDIPPLSASGFVDLASRLLHRPAGCRKRSIISMDRQKGGRGQSLLPDSLHDHMVTAPQQPEQSRPGSPASTHPPAAGGHVILNELREAPAIAQGVQPSLSIRLPNFRPLPYRPHSAGGGRGAEVQAEGTSSIHHGVASTSSGVTDPRNYVYRRGPPMGHLVAPTAEARLRPVRSWAVGGAGSSTAPPSGRPSFDLGISPGGHRYPAPSYGPDVFPLRDEIRHPQPTRERRAGSTDGSPWYVGQGTFTLSPVDFAEGHSPSSRRDVFRGTFRRPGLTQLALIVSQKKRLLPTIASHPLVSQADHVQCDAVLLPL